MSEFSELLGKTLESIIVYDDEILFFTQDKQYRMYHSQDCCESVTVDDIVGDIRDLLHTPILMAEEISNSTDPAKDKYDESYTWTFYKLATINGYVTIKWYGTSNGYYSESVSFEEMDNRRCLN